MIDSHAHLWFSHFDPDRDEVLARARAAGVDHMVVVGVDLPTSRAAGELAARLPGISASAGVHPNDCEGLGEADWSALAALLDGGGYRAVGETGLDLYWRKVPLDVQEAAFRRQIALAGERDLPVIIHCRDAMPELLGLLESRGRTLSGVMHCFSGDRADMRRALALGLDISFAGPVTYPKNLELREAARECPIDRIHVETDCPFLPPEGRRGRRNEPAFVGVVADAVAALKGLDAAAFRAESSRNGRRLFRIPPDVRR